MEYIDAKARPRISLVVLREKRLAQAAGQDRASKNKRGYHSLRG